jgi:GH15 family glucan-1,4-alpha-glucosidase
MAQAQFQPSLDLGVIGNCAVAALVDRRGAMVWSCFPSLDGDPVFASLLDNPVEPGRESAFLIEIEDFLRAEQRYVENTAVLETLLFDRNGGCLQILDFAPRFIRFERSFRPPQVVRRITPLDGRPRIRIAVQPRFTYGAQQGEVTRGSNHLRFAGPVQTLRLTTDAPISYVVDGTFFTLDRPVSLFFGVDEALRDEVDSTARMFLEKTTAYWRGWTRSLSVPFEWQEAVIRAAITLKLCSFEETGAIVAALTTSVPEAPGTARNWDYRFCWLRDATFVVHALNRLGATKTMEDYLSFITNIIDQFGRNGAGHLPPLYPIALAGSLDEHTAPAMAGYRGDGPVRYGNGAAGQIQNDGYGAVVLAAAQVFYDKRLIRGSNDALFRQLELLGERAAAVFDQPDAGPWELRGANHVHTFSAVMCWAACDRLARIAADCMDREDRARFWRDTARRMHDVISARCWNAEKGHFASTFGGSELDACLLLLSELGFIDPSDPRFGATVDAIDRRLRRGDLLLRYDVADDFGHMSTGFLICSFWHIDALHAVGRSKEARALFERILTLRNSFGLLSEDADPATGALWGNFPQTYSMVGLINSAMRLSRSWDHAF